MTGFVLPWGRPAVMGVLNVTPDSFSDGGRFLQARAAITQAEAMRADGADLVDVGGESTRPGSEPVGAEAELARVLPVVRALAARGVPVSIDTSKAVVARACLDAGAVVVNDVTALGDPGMADVVAEAGCPLCLMHMQGEPRTMQRDPQYVHVVTEVRDWLLARAARAEAAGVPRERVWIDPGIGFGKTLAHNLALLRGLPSLVATGHPVLVGVSRKSFLGRLLRDGDTVRPVEERLIGSVAAQVLAQAAGARILRVHDVRAALDAVRVTAAVTAKPV